MEPTDQDILEDLDDSQVRVAQILAALTMATDRAYHARNRIARLWWEWRVWRLDDLLAKADDRLHHLKRIARRRGLLEHRATRRATFSDHF